MRSKPYYLMVTFWGDRFREYFYSLCLSSLLSPNNLPALRGLPGCKFLIATTRNDWSKLEGRPLFERMRQYVEPVFIDIGYPGKGEPPILHMSKGHRLAARRAVEDGAWAGFFAPDLLVSDGSVAFVIDQARGGKRAVLVAALRYAMEPVVGTLRRLNLLRPDQPMQLERRLLAGLACESLHSEILGYDFEAPSFGAYPIWSYWRIADRRAMVVHTASWALLLGDFSDTRGYSDNILETDTIDSCYVYHNFYRGNDRRQLHLSTDSDEALFISLTPESELTFFPLQDRPINRTAAGVSQRMVDMGRFLGGPVFDDFRRWAYTIPVHIHGDELVEASTAAARHSSAVVRRALCMGTGERFLRHVVIALFQLVLEIRYFDRRKFAAAFRRSFRRSFRRFEAALLRLTFGRVIGPLLGRAKRETLARLLRVVPRRHVRAVLRRVHAVQTQAPAAALSETRYKPGDSRCEPRVRLE